MVISNQIPDNNFLGQNYPNPFNPSTVISYSIMYNRYTVLKIYNTMGNEVITLVNEKQNPGSYEVVFNGRNLSRGIYFYKLEAGEFTETR